MDTSTPAAPAQPAPVSATIAAANAGDFAAFDRAETAAREGKPLPAVADTPPAPPADATRDTPPVDAAPKETERAVSKRQEKINDYERRLAESSERIARLERQLAQPPAPTPPADPPAKATPEYKRYQALPDAPKLAEFDSVEDHTAAMALFIADKRHDERVAADRAKTDEDQQTTATQTRARAFDAAITEMAKTDPDLPGTLLPFAQRLGKSTGAYGIIRQAIFDSPHGPQLLRHFAGDEAALHALATMPDAIRALPRELAYRQHVAHILKELGRLETRFESPAPAAPAAPAAAVPSPISAAPPPPPTVTGTGTTTDLKSAALARGDFAEFDRLDVEDRLATLRR